MGVSILEGRQVERIATALEAFASAQDASELAQQAARDAQAAVQDAEDVVASASSIFERLEGITDDLDTLEELASNLTPSSIGAVSYTSDQSEVITPEQQAVARANIGLSDIDALTTGNVKYDADQTEELSAEEKAQARSNIGAASTQDIEAISEQLEDVDGLTACAVRYDIDQTTAVVNEDDGTIADMQEQLAELEEGSEEWIALTEQIAEAQAALVERAAITPEQQATARRNIGAASASIESTVGTIQNQLSNIDDLVVGAVKYTSDQTVPVVDEDSGVIKTPAITTAEQAVARRNIGAAGSSDLEEIGETVSSVSSAVNAIQQTINNGALVQNVSVENGELIVTYSDDQVSQGIPISAGIANVSYQNSHLIFYDGDNNVVHDFTIQGGSGTASVYYATLETSFPSNRKTVAEGQTVRLPFTYTEYARDIPTGNSGFLTATYKYSNTNEWLPITGYTDYEVAGGTEQLLDVTNLVKTGLTLNVLLSCTNGRQGADNVVKTFQFNITCVNMSIATTFNFNATYTGNFTIPYTCVGRDIQKTVYLYIDGREYTHVDVGTSHNKDEELLVRMVGVYEYGAHKAQLFFRTPDGAESNIVDFNIIYNNGASTEPIVALRLVDYNIDNGEPLDVRYTCYTPGQEYTNELTIRVFTTVDGQDTQYYIGTFENIPNNKEQKLLINNYPEKGSAFIEYISGETTDFFEFTVNEVTTIYGKMEQIKSGLLYDYRPAGLTNSTAGRELYVYETLDAANKKRHIFTRMQNFNWIADGYVDGESLTLNGPARMNINLPILTTSFENEEGAIGEEGEIDDEDNTFVIDATESAVVTTRGRTIEFEFEISNVTDQNATVFSCMDNTGAGFVITPQVCYLCSQGQAPEFDANGTGFIENEETIPCAYIKDEKRIRVSFVIDRARSVEDRFVSHASIFINGEYANSMLYDANARYNSAGTITIGSDYCTTKLYEVKIYNRDLDKSNILANHMNSQTNINARFLRNEFNDVLDKDGNVSYKLAKRRYPCLLFIGPLSNFKEDKKQTGVVLTKPDDKGGYTTEFSLLDTNEKGEFVCQTYVQGTSSVRFMRKNFKAKLAKAEKDVEGHLILDDQGKAKTKKVKYVLKGYDEFGKPKSIGESTLCFKMDYMSSDHANTFNANIADTLFKDKPNPPAEYSRYLPYAVGARVMYEHTPYECISPVSANTDWDPESWTEIDRYWLVQNTIYGFRCLLFNLPLESYTEGTAFDDYADGVIEFAGDGTLNNDKGNTKSFGLEDEDDDGNDTLMQKWEFKDNSQDPCNFLTDRLQKKVYKKDDEGNLTEEYTRAVKAALESCYPDEGDLEDDGLTPNYDHIQILFSWVCQRANFWEASTTNGTGGTYNNKNYRTQRELKKAIFINEFTRHFNMEHALVYYLFIEWVALADNRAKNMFLSCKNIRAEHIVFRDGVTSLSEIIDDEYGTVDISKIDWDNSTFAVWYTDLYDLDSCFGAENSGYLRVPYYAEWNFKLGDAYQFNGHESVFWCMFEEAFASEIKARAKEIVKTNTGYGALNYNVLKDTHITNNAELVCPAIVNEDMEYKYEAPWSIGYLDYSEDTEHPKPKNTTEYMYLMRGSRTEQKESFIYRRSNMLYSKYQCDPFINDQIRFRCGDAVDLAEGETVALSDSRIDLKAIQAMWMAVTYGDSGLPQVSEKKLPGQIATFTANNRMGRSDHIHIHGASLLTDISSLAKFKPYEIGLDGAQKLKTLLIGSNEPGYSNDSLTSLDTQSCKLLETLNIQNCTGLRNAINLSKNTLIRKIYASGSAVPYFTLSNSGIIDTLELGSPTDISLVNQPKMENFSFDDLDRLTSLRVEDTPNVHPLDILSMSYQDPETGATRYKIEDLYNGIRLINIDETISDRNIFKLLTSDMAKGKRMDANGNHVNDRNAYPIITGVIHCDAIGASQLADMQRIYGDDLVIDYQGEPLPQYVVTFENPDHTKIKDRKGNDYYQLVDQGSAAYDPVLAGEIDPPTMAPDAQNTYVFNGRWVNLMGQVQGPKTVIAQYDSSDRSYAVRWFIDKNRTQPIKTTYVAAGTEAVFEDDDGSNYPSRHDGDASYTYYVFDGWDKSTGCVVSDLDVYAKWKVATLPPPRYNIASDPTSGLNPHFKPLDQLDLAEIYSIARVADANEYWSPGEAIDIKVGADFDFRDPTGAYTDPGYIRSEVLAQDLVLDGTRLVTTSAQLFAQGATAFTLAIDYEFAEPIADSTLVACYSPAGYEGFRLFYSANGYPTVAWGDKQIQVGNYGRKRGMAVLLYVPGQKNLLVASSNIGQDSYNLNLTSSEGTRTQETTTDAVLTFGGTGYNNGGTVVSAAKGMVHWCKVWYGNLGLTMIKQLANWPHETWKMRYVGPNRYYAADGTGASVSATFIADAPLPDLYTLYAPGNNRPNGWDETELYTFINTRCFNALPAGWQQIIRPVNITITKSVSNLSSSEFTTLMLATKMHLPAFIELFPPSTNISNYNNKYASEGTSIDWYTTNETRYKFCGISIPDDRTIITASTDPSANTLSLTSLKDGDIWVMTNTSVSVPVYTYVSPREAAKHGYFGPRVKDPQTTDSNTNVPAASGGVWVRSEDVWTRTPGYYGYYFYHVTRRGGYEYSYYSGRRAIMLMFSI